MPRMRSGARKSAACSRSYAFWMTVEKKNGLAPILRDGPEANPLRCQQHQGKAIGHVQVSFATSLA